MIIQTIYKDSQGQIEATTELIGSDFILRIGKAEFTSGALNEFQRYNGEEKQRIMVDGYNRLLNCILKFKLPIKIIKNEVQCDSFIELEVTIGTEDDPLNSSISLQKLSLEGYSVQIKEGGFSENVFHALIAVLPKNLKIKGCITCAYSGYSVYGQGFFGCMICYRNVKEEYLKIQDKDDYVSIMESGIGNFMETYLCKDFAPQVKKAGYRIFYD